MKTIKDLTRQSETSNFFYILVGLLALLSILFVMGGDDGLPYTIGRIVALIIILILAYSLITWISHITEESEDWIEKESLDEDINLRIQDISELLKRASEGKEKSQEILHEKLRKVFFLKLKEIEDISDNDLRDLVKDPEEFRRLVQDEIIADFILSMEEESNETNSGKFEVFSSSNGQGEKKYKKKIKEVIQRIDSWEEKYHE
ncbi:MAG: hypothetical protein ACOCTN_07930 [Candidatus Natronoplasma sp.]